MEYEHQVHPLKEHYTDIDLRRIVQLNWNRGRLATNECQNTNVMYMEKAFNLHFNGTILFKPYKKNRYCLYSSITFISSHNADAIKENVGLIKEDKKTLMVPPITVR